MKRGKRRLVAGLIALLAALAGVAVTGSPAAAAGSCYGDYCSGQDPATTGVGGVPCANDGKTVAYSRVRINYVTPGGDPVTRTVDVGYVELRWSNRCQTNWARFTAEQSGYMDRVVATQDTGYQQVKNTSGYVGNTNPGTFWTNMIYSPVHHVQAQVLCSGLTGCGWLNATSWV